MDDLGNALRYIKKARGLIQNFALIDPSLWPILSEIDLALSRGETNHREFRQARTDARNE